MWYFDLKIVFPKVKASAVKKKVKQQDPGAAILDMGKAMVELGTGDEDATAVAADDMDFLDTHVEYLKYLQQKIDVKAVRPVNYIL